MKYVKVNGRSIVSYEQEQASQRVEQRVEMKHYEPRTVKPTLYKGKPQFTS